jgi:hypothetical protein
VSDDFDASAAARRATGEARQSVDDGVANQATAEGADPSGDTGVGSTSTLRDMLLSTDPDTPLEDVEAPYDPQRGGVTRIYRGIIKATGISGLPAIADIGIGVVEVAQVLNLDEADDDQEGDDRRDDRDQERSGEEGSLV